MTEANVAVELDGQHRITLLKRGQCRISVFRAIAYNPNTAGLIITTEL